MPQVYTYSVRGSATINPDTNRREYIDLDIFRWELTDKRGYPIDSTEMRSQMRENIISDLLDEEPEVVVDNVYFHLSVSDRSDPDGFMGDDYWFKFVYHKGTLNVGGKFVIEMTLSEAEKFIEKMLLDNEKYELPPVHEIR